MSRPGLVQVCILVRILALRQGKAAQHISDYLPKKFQLGYHSLFRSHHLKYASRLIYNLEQLRIQEKLLALEFSRGSGRFECYKCHARK